MLDWLFPNWSNPFGLTMLVGMRILLNTSLTAIVARAVGLRTSLTAAVGTATVLSTVLMVLVLRPGVLGLRASYVEFFVQIILLILAGYTVYVYSSGTRRIVTAVLVVGATALLLFTIPLYGEAFVAP